MTCCWKKVTPGLQEVRFEGCTVAGVVVLCPGHLLFISTHPPFTALFPACYVMCSPSCCCMPVCHVVAISCGGVVEVTKGCRHKHCSVPREDKAECQAVPCRLQGGTTNVRRSGCEFPGP